MKLPCGGCGKCTPGLAYSPSMGCFYCWSAKYSPKYAGYWEDADKIPEPTAEPVAEVQSERPALSYEPQGNPYQRDHHFTFSAPVAVSPPNQIAPQPKPAATSTKCVHRGEESGQIECPTCSGKVMVKTFACAIYSSCTLAKKVKETACCVGCSDFKGV